MAENTINITLKKTEGDASGFEPKPVEPDFTPQAPEFGSKLTGKAMSMVALASLAKVAYDLAKKGYERQHEIVKDDRNRLENLRQLGGAGFQENTFTSRFDIFGARIPGESVAYRS